METTILSPSGGHLRFVNAVSPTGPVLNITFVNGDGSALAFFHGDPVQARLLRKYSRTSYRWRKYERDFKSLFLARCSQIGFTTTELRKPCWFVLQRCRKVWLEANVYAE